jgi:hypothetical protein
MGKQAEVSFADLQRYRPMLTGFACCRCAKEASFHHVEPSCQLAGEPQLKIYDAGCCSAAALHPRIDIASGCDASGDSI